MPSLICRVGTTITCLLLVLLLLVLMAERARHLVHPVQRHLHQPRELDISSDLLMDTSARIFKFQGLHHLMMAARMPLPTSRSTQSLKEPNLVMPSTMTPSMTIAKASAMPQTLACLVVPTLVS